MNALHAEIERNVNRWPVAAGAKVNQFVRDRLQETAHMESRRIIATAQVELVNRAMLRWLELLYERDATGKLWNVAANERIRIPTPWSTTKHGEFGLTDHNRRILRRLIVERHKGLPGKYMLLNYNRGSWFLNTHYFPQLPDAQTWLARFAITPETWAAAADALPRRGHQGRHNGRR